MNQVTILGMTRIKQESRWIRQVLESFLPVCERIFVLDDNSSDGTPEVAESVSEKITVIRSIETTLDESRDKSVLLQRVMDVVPDIHLRGNVNSPFWCICFDGDEVLDEKGIRVIRYTLPQTPNHAFKMPIRYLWNSDLSLLTTPGYRQVRTDGVYRNFARPSIFRLFNRGFRFQQTPWGGNFHCSSIPQELLGHAHVNIAAPLWHLGYNDQVDRLRKWDWYNTIDPGNAAEDRYRHCVQGDIPSVPPNLKLLHAGPLRLEMM